MSGTLADCLARAVTQGRLTQAAADEAQAKVSAKLARGGINPADAAARTAEEMALAAAVKRRQAADRIIATDRSLTQARSHPRGFGAGVAALFARDMFGLAGYSNVEARGRAVLGEAQARFAQGIEAFRTKSLGLTRDVAGLADFIREFHAPGSTKNATARAVAQAWGETDAFLVRRFNAAGGNLPPRERYIPQVWNRDLVRASTQAEWTGWMRGEVEAGRLAIRDFDTGLPVDAARADTILADAYKRISTDGLVDLVPGRFAGQGSVLADKHNAARVFEWTDADAWLGFNRRYGVGDNGIYELLNGHLAGRSRDIGMLEIMGPNPQNLARLLLDTARKEGTSDWQVHKLEAIWDHVSGKANSPVSEGIQTWFRGVRTFLAGAQLGAATLSAVTDFATLTRTAAWNGIPAAQVMGRYVTLLNPNNTADQVLALRLGLIADGWTQRAAGAMRNSPDIMANDLVARVTDTVLRASGLQAHTQAGKWAFGMEFLGHLADQAGKPLDALDPPLQRAFRTYGITAEDWNLIRAAGLWEEDGVRFIRPEQVVTGSAAAPGVAQGAASRLLEMVQTETNFAVVEPGALERAVVLGRTKAGTFSGEIWRSMMQYKTFPLSMMTRHMMRGLESYRAGDRGRHLAATAVSLTVMGAMAMQLKAVAQGKDPRDMTSPQFWGAAAFQGGGMGIIGDFMNAGLNRSNQSFFLSMLGPTPGLVDDLFRLTGANITQAVEDKPAHFGAEMARFIQRNTPGTSLWYARLALDRMMWNRIQEQADPAAAQRWQRQEDRARRDFDQDFWWRPGRAAPDRAPSLTAAFGLED